jgi:hypothetical protein
VAKQFTEALDRVFNLRADSNVAMPFGHSRYVQT